MYYTYAHYTKDGNLLYIGKGHGKRAYVFYRRNNYWNSIVLKYGKPVVKIIAKGLSESEAFIHEIKLIKFYKESGIKLCNLSDGGEGPSGAIPWNKGISSGLKHSEEFKSKISALHKGNKWRQGIPTSAKQKAIASQLSKGNNYAAGNTAQRKWIWVGTHIKTGEVVKYIGQKKMKYAGLQHSNIIQCLNGKRKSHKGYTWSREAWSWH